MKKISASPPNSEASLSISAWTLFGLLLLFSAAQAQDKVSQSCLNLGNIQGSKGKTECASFQASVLVAQKTAARIPASNSKLVSELTAAQREEKFWDDAKNIGNKEAFEGYLASYPSGRYASLANASIQKMWPTKSLPAQEATVECVGNPESWDRCVGTQTLSDGGKYFGEYRAGRRGGQGTSTLLDGTTYVGEWKDDKPNGQGTRTWPDGAKYVGEFRENKRSGHGTFLWPD
jgi:hypothetical protein